MTVTVAPSAFTLVDYDAGRIEAIVSQVVRALGFPEDVAVVVDVDERTPLAQVVLRSVDPPVVAAEGGALEDVRRPRQLSEEAVVGSVGRLLGRARDRREASFAGAPPEEELELRHADAWDASTMGRLARAGLAVRRPRWLYRFRTRHGFTDAGDRVFERLWSSGAPSWDAIEEACRETAAVRG